MKKLYQGLYKVAARRSFRDTRPINSYSYKLFFAICSTPLFYAIVSLIKHIKNYNY